MKITLLLHNIRSVYNVGAILRTAEGLGIELVVYSGYTPRYDDQKLLPHLRNKLNHQIAKAALDAEKLVPQLSLNDDELIPWLEQQKTAGRTIIGLENNLQPDEMQRQIILGRPVTFDTKNTLSQPAVPGTEIILILGEEVAGVPEFLREKVDYFLEIPMQGRKESFNVSVATGIALWGLKNCY